MTSEIIGFSTVFFSNSFFRVTGRKTSRLHITFISKDKPQVTGVSEGPEIEKMFPCHHSTCVYSIGLCIRQNACNTEHYGVSCGCYYHISRPSLSRQTEQSASHNVMIREENSIRATNNHRRENKRMSKQPSELSSIERNYNLIVSDCIGS